jgi:valyl-tRNA synthetase
MTIPAQFDAKTIEDKWYAYWMETIISLRIIDIYTIVIPPPMLQGLAYGTC